MVKIYVPAKKKTMQEYFEFLLKNLTQNVKPNSKDLSFEEKILHSMLYKFTQIGHSILRLAHFSELSSLILARSLWEIAVDSAFLAYTNDQELWKKYFAYGVLDSLTLKLRAIKSLLAHLEYDESIEESKLIIQIFESCFIQKDKGNKELILPSILLEKPYEAIKPDIKNIHDLTTGIFNPDALQTSVDNTLKKIPAILTWRPEGKGFNATFWKFSDTLEKELNDPEMKVNRLKLFHSMLYSVGNSATHSSDTLTFIYYDLETNAFSPKQDQQTDRLYEFLPFIADLMGWALVKLKMIDQGKVAYN